MSRRNIILTAIAVVLFLGAGFILYRQFFAGRSSTPRPLATAPAAVSGTDDTAAAGRVVTPGSTPAAAASSSAAANAPAPALINSPQILPLGSNFDLTLVKKYNTDGKLFAYPKVDQSEVGPAVGDLVKITQ